MDEERVLSGSDARWSEPQAGWREEAERALLATARRMTHQRCWSLVENLEWGRSDPAKPARDVASLSLSLEDALGLSATCSGLVQDLRRRVETWEAATGRALPLSDDRLEYLFWHVVGLGRDVYARVFADPATALDLAPIEGFGGVVRATWQAQVATDEALANAVRDRRALASTPPPGAGSA